MALATSEVLAQRSGGVPSLVGALGGAVVDRAPGWLSTLAIDRLGGGDKAFLLSTIVVVCLGLGAGVGVAARRRRWVGPAAMAGFGAIGWLAAATTSGSSGAGALVAAALAVAVGSLALHASLALADLGTRASPDRTVRRAEPIGLPTRRAFLAASGAVVLASGAAVALGRSLRVTAKAAVARAKVVLPRAGRVAPEPAAAASFAVPGLTPLITANDAFYRIDEAIVVPDVDPDGWKLQVGGMVRDPFTLTYAELLAEPMIEAHVTLACVSNRVGEDLIGTARWLGVPLKALLDRAGVDPSASQVVGRSVDGFTVGFPTSVAVDGRDAMVAVGMNGEPLPVLHGFPARLVVPGLYGYVSATKWLNEIELSTLDAFDAYWIRRGWDQIAPVLTQSRIDVPHNRQTVAAGDVVIAGVAWAQHRGVSKVEVRVDDGPWTPAELAAALSTDTWRQWRFPWVAVRGDHTIAVRATDASGTVQEERPVPPGPNGATGNHTVRVGVSA
ncbi:MAG: molybdopterin-dependent oxidoreductase [Acidimicrobiales bacterium]